METTRVLPDHFSVHIKTEELYYDVIQVLNNHGFRWTSGRSLMSEERNYAWFALQNYTCLNIDNDVVCLSSHDRLPNFTEQEFLGEFGVASVDEINGTDISVLFI